MQPYQYQGEDTIFSHVRQETLTKAFEGIIDEPLSFAQSVLKGEKGFMCQYNRALGFDTIWSVVYDVSGGKIYRVKGSASLLLEIYVCNRPYKKN